MMRQAVFMGVTSLALTSCSLPATPPEVENTTVTLRIEGTVLSGSGGNPVDSATVQLGKVLVMWLSGSLIWLPQKAVETDENGSFSFEETVTFETESGCWLRIVAVTGPDVAIRPEETIPIQCTGEVQQFDLLLYRPPTVHHPHLFEGES